ncbi:unnamed protein product [Urochloa decumbens]|uniref:Uncharacterized protein n=1 Tax=Urochloa decumbens TaxID=240449 RepID=A0ABC9AEW1_9POAL
MFSLVSSPSPVLFVFFLLQPLPAAASAAAAARFRASRRREQRGRRGGFSRQHKGVRCMSTMAWYPLPQSGSAVSAGDEFFENQSSGWSLWSFTSSDDENTAAAAAAAYPDNHETAAAARSEEESAPALLEPQPCSESADDIFLNQFSDEEMRRMEAPFEALDMFPGSMHRLLSYEDMLSGVLTGNSPSEDQQDAKLEINGVDAMDTCGFPLFSHDLQNEEIKKSEDMLPADTLPMDKAGMGTMKRSRSFADDEGAGCFEGLVLEELEDVVFQLTKKTRICFRDAFFRMAETSSKAGASGSGRQGVQQAAEGNAPGVVPAPDCPERATNAIDRTVADLTMRPPCPAPLQVHGSCVAGGSGGAEAQSTTSWAASA